MTTTESRPGVVGATIVTRSGLYFDFADPKPEQIDVRDIAWGLAHTCRFNGQCKGFYSVAQHSVLASFIVPPEQAMAALMHDAAEAYTGDMVKPLKNLLPDFKEVEARVERAIAEKFGLPVEMSPEIKRADLRMLRTEQRDITAGAGDNWSGLSDFEPLPDRIIMQAPAAAYLAWRQRYMQLVTEVDNFGPSWHPYPLPPLVLDKPTVGGKKLPTFISDLSEELRRRGQVQLSVEVMAFRGIDPRRNDKLAQLLAEAIAGGMG